MYWCEFGARYPSLLCHFVLKNARLQWVLTISIYVCGMAKDVPKKTIVVILYAYLSDLILVRSRLYV